MRIFLFLLSFINILWATEIFVVNSGSETLTKIDLETNEVNNAFCSLGSAANRIALTQDFGYVVNSTDNNLQKIDLETGETISYIYIGSSTNPYDLIIDGNFCYVSTAITNQVVKIDLNSEEIIDQITVGNNPAGLAILNNKLFVGNTNYMGNYQNCTISVIDLFDFTLLETISVETNPQFLIAHNGKIHVSCGGNWSSISGKICIIDPDELVVEEIIEIGGSTSNLAAAANNVIYLGDNLNSGIYAYDALNYELIYNSANPFLPGAAVVTTADEYLFTLGGVWGQNFLVRQYDLNENLLAEYTVGLYATDIKISSETTESWENVIDLNTFKLNNFPNPFNPSTTISFLLTTESTENTKIIIYNLKGQKVKTLECINCVDAASLQMMHSIIWNGRDENEKTVPSGIYFYQLQVDGKSVARRKMLLMK